MKIIKGTMVEKIDSIVEDLSSLEERIYKIRAVPLDRMEMDQARVEISKIKEKTVSLISMTEKDLKDIIDNSNFDLDETRDKLYKALDEENNSYEYALHIYSGERLDKLPPVIRESMKLLLREYFAKEGLHYFGWDPESEDQIND